MIAARSGMGVRHWAAQPGQVRSRPRSGACGMPARFAAGVLTAPEGEKVSIQSGHFGDRLSITAAGNDEGPKPRKPILWDDQDVFIACDAVGQGPHRVSPV